MIARVVQQSDDLRTNDGVDGKERAEDDNVVGLDVGIDKVELIMRMIFIENVLRIVVVIEEGERDRRLRFREDVDFGSVHSIVFEKTKDILSHTVVAGFTDESGAHARTRHRDDGIKRRAARVSTDGLLMLEDDVKHRLSYSYYFSHT